MPNFKQILLIVLLLGLLFSFKPFPVLAATKSKSSSPYKSVATKITNKIKKEQKSLDLINSDSFFSKDEVSNIDGIFQNASTEINNLKNDIEYSQGANIQNDLTIINSDFKKLDIEMLRLKLKESLSILSKVINAIDDYAINLKDKLNSIDTSTTSLSSTIKQLQKLETSEAALKADNTNLTNQIQKGGFSSITDVDAIRKAAKKELSSVKKDLKVIASIASIV